MSREHAERAARASEVPGDEPAFAAWSEPVPARDPLELFAAARGPRFYWAAPERGIEIVALGEIARIETAGESRFEAAARAAEALFARVRASASGSRAAAPLEVGARLVGGFGFEPEAPAHGAWRGWPALRFALPEIALVRAGDRAWATVCARADRGAPHASPSAKLDACLALAGDATSARGGGRERARGFAALADRTPDAYLRGIERALDAIARGEVEKVVLARACTVALREGAAPAQVLASLRALHPGCFAFGIGSGDTCFVGATPERLLRREGSRLLASALAGSAPRGRTPEADARLAHELCGSAKEQAEHAAVRRAVREALAPLCLRLTAPDAPELLRLDGIQHLHSPLEGEVASARDAHLLRAAARLHPTPAICGAPREAARAFLAEHEALERGWYAGGVGWLAPGGDGELAVPLRCALLRGRRATLFAGAGIVEGSDPRAELAETRLKLQAALGALVEL